MRRTRVRNLASLAMGTTLAVAASTLAVSPAGAADRPRPVPQRPSGEHRSAFAAAKDGKVRLAVELADGADAQDVIATARGNGAALRHHIEQIGVVSVEVAAEAADKVAAALSRRPGVVAVTPVGTRSTGYTPDDTLYAGSQTYLADVNAPAAWEISKGHTDVLVAIVDSGVDVAHPDLSAKIAGAYNADTGTSTVTDVNGHGTFVAGVAAAATDNATGIAGAGFNSRLLAVKVDDPQGNISTDTEADGIVWAVDNGADVINISLGGSIDATEQAAVEYAIDEGVVVVASAGNENTNEPSYPAAYTDVIAVGATTGTTRSVFSNYGSWVDVGAPGTDIKSTTPTAGSVIWETNGYDVGDGTSFSSPMVAGQVALMLGLDQTFSPAALRNAVTAATTGSYGFAHGRVDFAQAFTFLPPTSLPTWTVPATDGTTVSGDTPVSVETDAPKAKFVIAGGPTTTVDTASGVASGTVETFGLAGNQTITAYACNTAGCNVNGVARTVVVDNGVPTVTAPAASTVIQAATFEITATAPADSGVKFLVDGNPVGFDGTAPYAVTVNSSALTNGGHTITAVVCNRAGTICDTANPSAGVAIVIDSLHPKVVKISPNPFSPNGDRLVDTTTVRYTVDVTQNVVLRIKNSAGTIVRGPGPLGARPAGTSTWVWNGRRSDGVVAPDGTYTVELLTSAGAKTGFASGTVRVDRTAPLMKGVSGSGTTFYPYKDSYKDTFTPAVTVYETARLVLNVYNSAGSRVRTIDAGVKSPGRYGVTWNGRRSDGSMVPAGTYRYSFTASDAARNARTTGRYTVYVSAKKAVAKLAQETVSPFGSVVTPYIGDCSAVYYDVRGWAGSLGYRSNETNACTVDEVSDYAVTEHSFALRSAVMYGNVRIAITGQAGSPSRPGNAQVVYLDKAGNATNYGYVTGAAYGTYWGPAGSANLFRDGRVITWLAGTTESHYWDARSFTVKYVYYVLA